MSKWLLKGLVLLFFGATSMWIARSTSYPAAQYYGGLPLPDPRVAFVSAAALALVGLLFVISALIANIPSQHK